MTYLRLANWYFFVLALLSGLLLFGFTQMARAEEREFRHRESREFRDSRYHHDRYYPARGLFVDVLPRGHRVIVFRGAHYRFFEGIWYRPVGRRFQVVAPPIGLVVPFLPPYYSTIWVGGVPYYYANEIYYVQGPGGYVVAEPPRSEVTLAPPQSGPLPGGQMPPGLPGGQMPPRSLPGGQMPSGSLPGGQMYIYPRQGQSPEKQARDRTECHSWAENQAGYDPERPPVGLPETQTAQKQADYKRAMDACLDARGYSVK